MFKIFCSRLVGLIKAKGNKKTEVRLAELLRAVGINGWRRHLPISGRPDFAFRKQKVAVFGPLRPTPA